MKNKRLRTLILTVAVGVFLTGCESTSKAHNKEDQDKAAYITQSSNTTKISNINKENKTLTTDNNDEETSISEKTITDKSISKDEAIKIVEKETGLTDLVYIDIEDFDGIMYYQIEGPGEEYVYFVNTQSGVIFVIDPEIANLITYKDWIQKINNFNKKNT